MKGKNLQTMEMFIQEGGRIQITPYLTRGDKVKSKNNVMKAAVQVRTRMDNLLAESYPATITIEEIVLDALTRGKPIIATPSKYEAIEKHPAILAFELNEDEDEHEW